jgi:hypothetical protein
MNNKHSLTIQCPDPLTSLRVDVRRRSGRTAEGHWTLHLLTASIRFTQSGTVMWRTVFNCINPLSETMFPPLVGPAVLEVQHEEPEDSDIMVEFNGAWLPHLG